MLSVFFQCILILPLKANKNKFKTQRRMERLAKHV